jgi:hypothetical protein
MKTHSIRNLLHRLDVVAGNEFVISVEKLDTAFLEGSLSQEKALDP